MTATVHIQPELEYDLAKAQSRWAAIDNENVATSVFTQFELVLSLCESFGWTLTPVFWNQDGRDVLAALFVVRTRLLLPEVVVPPFSPYSSIALSHTIADNERYSYLKLLLAPVPGVPTSRTIVLDPQLSPFDPQPEGYTRSTLHTYEISLDGTEEISSSFSDSTKRNLKSHQASYEFQPTLSVDVKLGVMVEAGYRNHGRQSPLSSQRLLLLAQRIGANLPSSGYNLVEIDTGAITASMLLLTDSKNAWYWMAGSQRGPSMTVLLTRALEYLRANGITRFNFMGANTVGIAEFKRRFGGELVEYVGYSKRSKAHHLVDMLGTWKRAFRG